ncbi:hypothetical protein V5J35_002931 [Endozoicomonas sp. NE40]|uniref:Uncharacterized protein n=1 Tax=Endozoicomonas lisbonensis TaxID=3120522 RepID=A0ABV2SKV7_9GAMM
MREYCGYKDQSLRIVVIYAFKINELISTEGNSEKLGVFQQGRECAKGLLE